ncbi:Hypothetical predicted protein [Podarcis lilfordi]|uniref:Uncharacterized protein n=1 Tax=Podarcis lilfordi TaxID=74358 RepID=A0AA35K088_9SAUR|nr:Hypothetical predicted protein [Podarcis lilfordi]
MRKAETLNIYLWSLSMLADRFTTPAYLVGTIAQAQSETPLMGIISSSSCAPIKPPTHSPSPDLSHRTLQLKSPRTGWPETMALLGHKGDQPRPLASSPLSLWNKICNATFKLTGGMYLEGFGEYRESHQEVNRLRPILYWLFIAHLPRGRYLKDSHPVSHAGSSINHLPPR